jgi:SLT domain-containing protein
LAVSAGDAYLDIHSKLAANFGRQLFSQVQAPVTKAGEQASHHFARSFGHGLSAVGKGIGAGIAGGLGLAVLAAVKLTPVLKQSVQGYRDHLKVVADTAAALKSMGHVAGVSVKDINRLSDALERKTGVDGDVIQSGQNVLLTFGNIANKVGKGNDIFNQASAAAVDMSARFKQDVNSSFVQLGKALDNPVKGLTALSRIGVSFSASETKQIKSLVAHNKVLDAQKIILAAVNRQVAGSAAAQMTASDRMQVAWRQLQDTIGSVLLPVVDRFENSLGKKVIPDLNVLATKYGPAIQSTLLRWVDGFNRTLPSVDQLGVGLRVLAAAFAGRVLQVQATGFTAVMERLGATGRKVVDWAKGFGPMLERIGQSFGKLFTSSSQVGPALQQAGGGGHAFANSLLIIGPILDVVARNLHNILPWLPAILAGFLAFGAIKRVTTPLVQVGELIGNIAAPFRIAALFGQKRALQAHTTALMENTAALGGNTVAAEASTVAGKVGILTSLRARAAMIGQAIAAKAVAVASKAWAAVQWLVNAALTANPIGIVIVAIAALAAGIVIAYKRSDTFRRVVDTVFRAIRGAVGTAVNFIIGLLRSWLDVQFNVVAGILRVMGKLPGPMGAPFRKAEEAVRGAKKTIDTQLDGVQKRVNRLTGKTIDIKARTDVEITKSVRQYLAASNVPGFHARGDIIRRPTLAVVGEGRAPESVIPWDPAYRTRALDLWTTTGRQLGVPGFQMGALAGRFRTPTIDETRRIGISEGRVAAAVIRQLFNVPGSRGAVDQVAKWTAAILGRAGEWAAWARRIMFESGGNWSAVNRTDSNWRAGHPSVGGAQVIRGTFAANAGRFRNVGPFLYGVSINPYANSYAGGHYAIGRYGSLAAVDPLHRAMGYDQGGWLPPGRLALNTTGRPEALGFDYDKLGQAVAKALREQPPRVTVDDIAAGQARASRRVGGVSR